MKTKTAINFFIIAVFINLYAANLNAQITPEFKFYLAFEDGTGNKDTIYAGYDAQGTIGIDSNFDEYDIKNLPFDSVFEVRFSNFFNAVADEYGYINNDNTSFHTKNQILSNSCYNQWLIHSKVIPILIHSKNFPIKVKWNNVDAFNYADSCLQSSIFNYVNPIHWFDVGTFYSPVSSFSFNKYLRFNDSIVFDSILVWVDPLTSSVTEFINMPPEHFVDANGDTIRLLYFGFFKDLVTETFSNENSNVNIHPNPANEFLIIEGLNTFFTQIQIFDVFGRLLLQKQNTHKNNTISIGELPKGMLVVRLEVDNRVVVKKILKY